MNKVVLSVMMLAVLLAFACGLYAGPYNGRYAFIAVGNGASESNKLAYKTWVNKKLWDATESNSVIRIWNAAAQVRSVVKTNQTAQMRCVNVDRLHADGRFKRYVPDVNLESRIYQQATNIMGSDAKFVWAAVTDDMTLWTNYFTRITN